MTRSRRFRSRKRLRSRAQSLADVGRWLEDFAEIEAVLGDRAKFRLGDIPQLPAADGGRQGTAVADQVRTRNVITKRRPTRSPRPS